MAIADGLPETSLDNPCDPLEGQCDPPSGNPADPLVQASEAIGNMSDNLVLNWFQPGVCAEVESDVPEITDYGDVLESFQTLLMHFDGEVFGYGAVTVLTDPATGIIDMEMVVADGVGSAEGRDGDPESAGGVNVQWTLRQTIWTGSGGQMFSLGTLDKIRVEPPEEVSYVGGWIYYPQNGPSEHPDSDAWFHAEVAAMFGCDATVAGFGVGNALSLVGNLLSLAVYYFRDLSIPWSNPTSCSGPIILDGTGQSCHGVNISCRTFIAEMAKKIGSIPGVTRAFKKCMKGRFGCGGSTFPRLRIRCGTEFACGPCGSGAGGCNLLGRDIWYCDPDALPCTCIEIIFHEAVHSCGIGHSLQYQLNPRCDISGERACIIGAWFRTQFINQHGGCIPGMFTQSSD